MRRVVDGILVSHRCTIKIDCLKPHAETALQFTIFRHNDDGSEVQVETPKSLSPVRMWSGDSLELQLDIRTEEEYESKQGERKKAEQAQGTGQVCSLCRSEEQG